MTDFEHPYLGDKYPGLVDEVARRVDVQPTSYADAWGEVLAERWPSDTEEIPFELPVTEVDQPAA